MAGFFMALRAIMSFAAGIIAIPKKMHHNGTGDVFYARANLIAEQTPYGSFEHGKFLDHIVFDSGQCLLRLFIRKTRFGL
jgi:hypothetical protein